MVTISEKRFDKLMRYEAFLECLEAAGVDNWDGYDDACEMFKEMYDAD